MADSDPRSAQLGRLAIAIAAILWSLSGLLTRLLQVPTVLHLHEPRLSPLQIAFFRALFAGLVLVPLLRPSQIRVRPLMLLMVMAFASMNALFLSAIACGPAAQAILLQNTAPFFVFVVTVFILGEPADRRSWHAVLIGSVGLLVILASGLTDDPAHHSGGWPVLLMGLGSGAAYALVILSLRQLRTYAAPWLVVQNHLGSAVCLATAVSLAQGFHFTADWLTLPSPRQIVFLFLFGSLQMALPYWLFARGLRSIHPQEASAITLIEPLLNPLWAFLISPQTDTPRLSTWIGGILILGALAYRYWPTRTRIAT